MWFADIFPYLEGTFAVLKAAGLLKTPNLRCWLQFTSVLWWGSLLLLQPNLKVFLTNSLAETSWQHLFRLFRCLKWIHNDLKPFFQCNHLDEASSLLQNLSKRFQLAMTLLIKATILQKLRDNSLLPSCNHWLQWRHEVLTSHQLLVNAVSLTDQHAFSCNFAHCFVVGSLQLLSSMLELISIIGKLFEHLLYVVVIVEVLSELAVQHLYLLGDTIYLLSVKKLLTFDVFHNRNLSCQTIWQFLGVVYKSCTLIF